MAGAKNRIWLDRLNRLASCCDDSQSQFTEQIGSDLDFRRVNDEAIEYWDKNWVPISRRCPPEGGWDWRAIHDGRRQKIDEFCVAIWHQSTTLCGLCLLSIRDNSVRLEAVEGNPDENHPLKGYVVTIAIDIAERLADSMSRSEVWLVEPADGLVDLYVNGMGFSLYEEAGRRVCKRRV
jgi:hypothetical protein